MAKKDTALAGHDQEEYKKALQDLVGDREPVEIMTEFITKLKNSIEGLSEEALHKNEKKGKWSIAEVIHHLADTELIYGYRLRLAMAAERPEFQDINQDRWATILRYPELDYKVSLKMLSAFRDANLQIIRNIDQVDMSRVGVHSKRGPEKISDLLVMWAGHDLMHLNQVKRIKKAVT